MGQVREGTNSLVGWCAPHTQPKVPREGRGETLSQVGLRPTRGAPPLPPLLAATPPAI